MTAVLVCPSSVVNVLAQRVVLYSLVILPIELCKISGGGIKSICKKLVDLPHHQRFVLVVTIGWQEAESDIISDAEISSYESLRLWWKALSSTVAPQRLA